MNNLLRKQNFIVLSTLISGIFIVTAGYFLYPTKKIVSPFATEKPTRKTLEQFITAAGRLKPLDHIMVGTLIAAKVQEILVDDNDIVTKGQLLAVLDNGIGDSAVKQAEGTLKEAQANLHFQEKFFQRQKKLYESGELSQNTFDQVTQNYHIAHAKVLQAEGLLAREKQLYDNLFIKSPVDGTIIVKNISIGQMLTAQLSASTLFEIAKDLTKMEVYIDVDEADVGMIKDKQEVIFTVDSFPYKHFSARIKKTRYLAKVENNVVTYNTIIDVDNPDLVLRPGMTTNVEIKVAETKNSLCIANKALRINSFKLIEFAKAAKLAYKALPKTKQKFESIWVLENNVIKQVKVSLGVNNGKFTEIKSGIDEHANVITEFFAPKDQNAFLKQFFKGGVGK